MLYSGKMEKLQQRAIANLRGGATTVGPAPTWVGCDNCPKWRLLSHRCFLVAEKMDTFFCNYLVDTSCATPDDEEDVNKQQLLAFGGRVMKTMLREELARLQAAASAQQRAAAAASSSASSSTGETRMKPAQPFSSGNLKRPGASSEQMKNSGGATSNVVAGGSAEISSKKLFSAGATSSGNQQGTSSSSSSRQVLTGQLHATSSTSSTSAFPAPALKYKRADGGNKSNITGAGGAKTSTSNEQSQSLTRAARSVTFAPADEIVHVHTTTSPSARIVAGGELKAAEESLREKKERQRHLQDSLAALRRQTFRRFALSNFCREENREAMLSERGSVSSSPLADEERSGAKLNAVGYSDEFRQALQTLLKARPRQSAVQHFAARQGAETIKAFGAEFSKIQPEALAATTSNDVRVMSRNSSPGSLVSFGSVVPPDMPAFPAFCRLLFDVLRVVDDFAGHYSSILELHLDRMRVLFQILYRSSATADDIATAKAVMLHKIQVVSDLFETMLHEANSAEAFLQST
ncbi:unnamed protein product [Amoebophrya sp. A25]|nr:unnamed protein product [Amoebophrya sp. A25]|eukprot:GSA25T00006205001.1